MTVWVNGERTEQQDGLTVAVLLTTLSLDDAMVAVAVNRDFVPRGHHRDHVLNDGDRVDIVAPMQGG